jgi:pyruvate kinase
MEDTGKTTQEPILSKTTSYVRKTKIICTIGPSCADEATIVKMLDLGMNVASLNFSHSDHAYQGALVASIREANRQRPDKPCAIMLDTKGPEIRTGALRDHQAVELTEGQDLVISTDYTLEGNSSTIACSYANLHRSVKVGSMILIADGTIRTQVTEILLDGVKVRVANSAKLGENKTMCLPGCVIDLPTTTEQDYHDLENFALVQNLDFIAASFVRRASDVEEIRNILGPRGAHIKIISKIQNHEGLENFEEILRVTDGVMVVRGDLAMEIPPDKVLLAQKYMINQCQAHGKYVVTATQMLESMVSNPRPSRAEASNVANAVSDGTDVVMLSDETAGGSYPLNAVKFMAKICVEAELGIDYPLEYERILASVPYEVESSEAVCSSAVHAALTGDVKLMVVITDTGVTAQQVAKYRPPMPILAVSISQSTINQLNVVRGCITFRAASYEGTDTLLQTALNYAKTTRLVTLGDKIVAVHGHSEVDVSLANTMKILVVD